MSFAFLRAERMVKAALAPLFVLSERSCESVRLSRTSGYDIVYLLRWPIGVQQHFTSFPGRRWPDRRNRMFGTDPFSGLRLRRCSVSHYNAGLQIYQGRV